MKKSIVVTFWDATKGNTENTSFIYHGITREKGIITFIKQYFYNDYNTADYPEKLDGIYKSHVIKDRLLYDFSENIVVYSQYV